VWGRFRVIREAREKAKLPTLESVLQLPQHLNADVPSYTWTWAAAMLLSEYPDSRPIFVQAARDGRDSSTAFTADLYRRLRPQWPVIRARWRLLLHDLEYGFDWPHHRVTLSTDDPRYDRRAIRMAVAADRSWQSAGYWFPAGTTLTIAANGQCLVSDPEPSAEATTEPTADSNREFDREAVQEDRDSDGWVAGPPGITAAFHRGTPLGQLQVAVLPIRDEDSGDTLPPLPVRPAAGLDASRVTPDSGETIAGGPWFVGPALKIDRPSWLLFRIAVPPRARTDASASDASSFTVSLQPLSR